MILHRSLITLACTALLAACGAPSGSDSGTNNAPASQITIGSNPAGTHVYSVAAALAKVLQEDGGMRASIRPFSGSSVYLPMLQRGEIVLGLNTSIDSYLSYHGLAPYDTPMSNLRALGMMFPLDIAYMARADSGLHRVEDLRGRRVVVTFRANAALRQLHTAILATGGLTLDDVTPITVAGLPEAMNALKEGRADAVPTGLNTALALEVNSALSGGIRYITMGADEGQLPAGMPGARVYTVEPGADSVGLEGPTRVARVGDFLNTGAHVSDERAYAIIKTIHTNWAELQRENSQMRSTPADAIAPADMVHPYHPGAVRYYRESGLWTDEHEANQIRLLGER